MQTARDWYHMFILYFLLDRPECMFLLEYAVSVLEYNAKKCACVIPIPEKCHMIVS